VTLVIAHRGAHGPGVPENTLAAFERAIALGADMVEFDVRRAPNGRLIVSHDVPEPERAGHLPALAEALELCRGRIAVNVELKEPGYVPDVLALLPEDNCLLTSFHEDVIREARKLAPALATGRVIDRYSAPDALARSGATHPMLEKCLPTLPGCFVWTVNDAPALRRFLTDPAVLGIITDAPELALELRARISARTEPVAPS